MLSCDPVAVMGSGGVRQVYPHEQLLALSKPEPRLRTPYHDPLSLTKGKTDRSSGRPRAAGCSTSSSSSAPSTPPMPSFSHSSMLIHSGRGNKSASSRPMGKSNPLSGVSLGTRTLEDSRIQDAKESHNSNRSHRIPLHGGLHWRGKDDIIDQTTSSYSRHRPKFQSPRAFSLVPSSSSPPPGLSTSKLADLPTSAFQNEKKKEPEVDATFTSSLFTEPSHLHSRSSIIHSSNSSSLFSAPSPLPTSTKKSNLFMKKTASVTSASACYSQTNTTPRSSKPISSPRAFDGATFPELT